MTKLVTVRTKNRPASYDIAIGKDSLADAGNWAAAAISNRPGKAAIISNKKVYGLYGRTIEKSLTSAGFKSSVHLIGDGERFKSLKTLDSTLKFLSENKLTRTDAVVALGGGVVGDLAGFAASIYLRGIEFLQVPTTLLSMIDSSVGGKTGVNSSFGKNLIGAFYQPRGVLIDVETLRTLPNREVTAGFCEAVKHGAIGGKKLFVETAEVLDRLAGRRLAKAMDIDGFAETFSSFLASQVSLKARIVAGDERESVERTDAASRKVLNFGHTFGHALEKVTDYRYFKHGEAVGHGIRFAAELSKSLELLAPDEVELLNDVLRRAGKLPSLNGIDSRQVFATFKFDKKLVNNSLNWILLKKIGEPVIFPHSMIPPPALMSAFKYTVRG